MSKKLVVLSDRAGLIDRLINAGDRALTKGLYRLLKMYWSGVIVSAGWKNFPYYCMKAIPKISDEDSIRNLFDRWCDEIDLSERAKALRQQKYIAIWEQSFFQRNALCYYLDKHVRKRNTRGIFETLAPYIFKDALRYRFKKIISRADTVVFNGGGLIADHLSTYLPGYLLEAYYAKKKGKHVVTLNQTVSVQDGLLKHIVSMVYKELDFHGVREPLSKKALVDLGVAPDRIRISPDTAFAVDISEVKAIQNRQVNATREEKLTIAITVRGDRALKLSFWLEVCEWAMRKHQCEFAFVHTCKAHDGRVVRRLRTRVPIEEIDCHGDYREIVRTFTGFDCVITDRYHAVIFALLASKPVVGIQATTFKIDGLLNFCGYPLPAVDLNRKGAAHKAQSHINHILTHQKAILNAVASIRKRMCDLARRDYSIVGTW